MHDLTEITAFTRVMATGSFAGAAQLSGITASAVSKAVSRLEARLGVKLLVRTTRRVRPTEAGSAFHARCERILSDLADAEREVAALQRAPRGLLRVEVPLTLGARAIIPALPDFIEKYPELELDVRSSDIYADLVAGDIDAAVRVGHLDDSRLVARKLATTRNVLVSSAAYVAKHGAPRSVSELAAHPALLFRSAKTGRTLEWRFARGTRTLSQAPVSRASFSNSEAIIAAAASGLGIAQLLDVSVALPIERGELVELLAESSVPGPPVWLVCTREKSALPKVRAFHDFFARRFGNPRKS
jgi:LysR family transcriptional regulator for bpeEF and oprC